MARWNLTTLAFLALFSLACQIPPFNGDGGSDSNSNFLGRDIRGVVRAHEKYVVFYLYDVSPCGCEARPVQGGCLEAGDACYPCSNCFESATISDEFGQTEEITNEWHTDLNGSIFRSEGYAQGDIVSIEVRGCESFRKFSITVPPAIGSSSIEPVVSGTSVHYSWQTQSSDEVEIMASDGLRTKYCWIDDTGQFELPWGGILYYAAIDHLKFREQIDASGWPIKIYSDSGTFFHYI